MNSGRLLVLEVHVEIVAVRGRLAVLQAFDLELVQVVILPAECRLDVLVKDARKRQVSTSREFKISGK